MQLLEEGKEEGQVSQNATGSSEYISVVKGAESSLANWGRGWAPLCPTFKYHTPRGLVGISRPCPD